MNRSFLFYLVLSFCVGRLFAQTNGECESIPIINDEVYFFESASPYDKSLCAQVTAALGYKLEVTIKTIDIDGTDPLYDHLLIKPGQDMDDPGPGKIFTHILNTERSYVLYSNNAYLEFNAHEDSNNNINPNGKKGFKVTFQRIGEETITTTTEAPDLNPLPTPGGTDTIYLTVHLSGKRLRDYTQAFVDDLQNVIIDMAKTYAEFASIPIDPDSGLNTRKNVLIHSLMDCPWNWPDREHCTSMEFSLPLHMQRDYEGYQLNRTNLRNMWFHFSSEYLNTLGLQEYEVPDAQTLINIWLIVIGCVVGAFVVFLGVFKWLLNNVMRKKGASLINETDDNNSSSGIGRTSYGSQNSEYRYTDQDDMQPDPYQTFPQASAYEDEEDKMNYIIYDNHSKPKPEFNRVVLMDPVEYGEAYS